MINVGLNISSLLSTKTGIGQYVQQLSSMCSNNPYLNMHYFCGLKWVQSVVSNDPTYKKSSQLSPVIDLLSRITQANFGARMLKDWVRQESFSFGAKIRGIDLYHEPNFIPFRFNKPTVITVHDMSPFRLPMHHRQELVKHFERCLPRAICQSSAIIVDSNFVKDELINYFPEAAKKIYPVYLAAGLNFSPKNFSECANFLRLHSLRYKSYFLAVGTLEPRKNLITAIRAYALLPDALRKNFPFVIAGAKGWLNEGFQIEAQKLVDKGQIRILGYVADEDLPRLYSSAVCLIYPSVYEGFGLPPLEAMACALPVVTSNVASLPEVVGDAAITLDPHDVIMLRDAMLDIVEGPELQARLSEQSIIQARKFSWQLTAEKTVEVYKKCLNE